MIETDNLETAAATRAHHIDVILWIDEEARRLGGEVPCRECLTDGCGLPDQEPTTLARRFGTCMRDNRLECAAGDFNP
jgi:hypothetical protein